MSRRRITDDEHAVWTGFTRSIEPLRKKRGTVPAVERDTADASKIAVPAGDRPQDRGSQASEPTTRPPDPGSSRQQIPPSAPPLAPLGRRLKQRVARGHEPIDARLDLHGYTQAEAHAALLRFLRRAHADGSRTVLVVTGKGTRAGPGSNERGVLKRQVPLWLALPEFRNLVVGFEDAHIGHGGTGALYVRLRRSRNQP
jgi:DNA-nicking Smr family endonuclease